MSLTRPGIEKTDHGITANPEAHVTVEMGRNFQGRLGIKIRFAQHPESAFATVVAMDSPDAIRQLAAELLEAADAIGGAL